jgi:hypothetical protein
MANRKRSRSAGLRVMYEYEYVTSTVSLLHGDGIVVHVVNDSPTAARAQVVVYKNTGAGAVTVDDSNSVVVPSWSWGFAVTVAEDASYWLRIRATSAFLIPKALFEHLTGGVWVPVVTYRPGDFAVFKLKPVRKRLW